MESLCGSRGKAAALDHETGSRSPTPTSNGALPPRRTRWIRLHGARWNGRQCWQRCTACHRSCPRLSGGTLVAQISRWCAYARCCTCYHEGATRRRCGSERQGYSENRDRCLPRSSLTACVHRQFGTLSTQHFARRTTRRPSTPAPLRRTSRWLGCCLHTEQVLGRAPPGDGRPRTTCAATQTCT